MSKGDDYHNNGGDDYHNKFLEHFYNVTERSWISRDDDPILVGERDKFIYEIRHNPPQLCFDFTIFHETNYSRGNKAHYGLQAYFHGANGVINYKCRFIISDYMIEQASLFFKFMGEAKTAFGSRFNRE